MRYFCCLASLFLLQTVTGVVDIARDELIKKNESISSKKSAEVPVHKLRGKREAHVHARRDQRQVGFFETSGENICENEFVTQEVRGPGIRDDEKSDGDVRSVQIPYEQDRQNTAERNPDLRSGEAYANQKFQLFHMNDDELDSDEVPYRKQRQAKHFESSAEVLRGPDKPEVNKNFINLLRWNKNKETISDLFPPGVQKNDVYPVNDDVADFAVYMNKTNKKKTKAKSGVASNSWDRKYSDLTEDNELASDYSGNDKHHQLDRQINSEENTILHEDTYSGNSPKVKKDADNTFDDFLFPVDDVNRWEKTKSNSQKGEFYPYASVGNLIKSASVSDNEVENDSSESSDRPQEDVSSVVGDIVREKTITLPEPLVFNSSHVVASFTYTMIPFRSPLLNLLENDKHSKYIMIKIDPVLQPSKRISLSDPQLKGDNIEYTLEKNVMRVIEKLIASDFQWDFTSVEGQPRSKLKFKNMNNRYYRLSDDQTASENQSSLPGKIKRFNGVIS